MNLLSKRINSTRFVVVDLETTGFNAQSDRVVEAAIRLYHPAQGILQSFDTLINPERAMSATQYHGIREDHVRDAPTFREVAPVISAMLSSAVLASYNVRYDSAFLESEFRRMGMTLSHPQVCLMLLKPMLDLGPKRALREACDDLKVEFSGPQHLAADDADAALALLKVYLHEFERRDILTFGDLRTLGERPFLATLSRALKEEGDQPFPTCRHLSRRSWPISERTIAGAPALKEYFDALVDTLSDSLVTPEELAHLAKLRDRLNLTGEQIGALHARAYLCLLMNAIGDDWLDGTELESLARLVGSRRSWLGPGCAEC